MERLWIRSMLRSLLTILTHSDIRERAIFTLRALLQGNEQSQGLIAQLKPISSPSAAT